jgi:hypothetical protein
MGALIAVNYKGVEITLRQVDGQYCPCWSARFDDSDCCERSRHLTLFEALEHAKTLVDQREMLKTSQQT